MKKSFPPVYYSDYLQLDKLLNSQHPKSNEYESPAHEEMLFIIVHQAYELWFKQILHELTSISKLFREKIMDEKNMGIAVSRLNRITEIQKLLIDQLRVLETMTPLDFLDFRNFLVPASGFQSWQFRVIENRLGLKRDERMQYNNKDYFHILSEEHRNEVINSEKEISLFELVEKWLERIPFLESTGFTFWESYKVSVEKMLNEDKEIIENNPALTDSRREYQLKEFESTRESFGAIFDENKYKELQKEGKKRLSYKAMLAALFINLYRDEPILHMPFRFILMLVDIDELFTTWRYRHALMVHRMIGSRIGTGGSSGQSYLMSTVMKHRIFSDLFDLSTYLIPRAELPKLPEELIKKLGFYYIETFNEQ
jgi:tryptophan 2,3-dioxygenase